MNYHFWCSLERCYNLSKRILSLGIVGMVDVAWIGLCPEKCENSKQPKKCDKQPSNSSNSRIQSRIDSGFFCGYSVGYFDAISTKNPCQPHSQNSQRNGDISPGWWYTYPSETYDFVSWGYYSQYMGK